jgi:hypothetical protein
MGRSGNATVGSVNLTDGSIITARNVNATRSLLLGDLRFVLKGDLRAESASVTDGANVDIAGSMWAGSVSYSRYVQVGGDLDVTGSLTGSQAVHVTGDLQAGGSVLNTYTVMARGANISGHLQVEAFGHAMFSGDAVNIGGLLSVEYEARATFLGDAIDIGHLSVNHRGGILTPNATSVTVRGTVHLEPHFYTQCAGQDVKNPMGIPAGNGKNKTQQHMVCNMSAITPASDCVMGGTPKGPLTTDPAWLHAYLALNSWCFKDASGEPLFESVACPGGSESACMGYCCTDSPYVLCDGYTDVVCQGRCQALCS